MHSMYKKMRKLHVMHVMHVMHPQKLEPAVRIRTQVMAGQTLAAMAGPLKWRNCV